MGDSEREITEERAVELGLAWAATDPDRVLTRDSSGGPSGDG